MTFALPADAVKPDTAAGAATGVGAEGAGGGVVTEGGVAAGGVAAGGVLLEPAVAAEAVVAPAALEVTPPGLEMVLAVPVAVLPDFAVVAAALEAVDALGVLAVVEALEFVPLEAVDELESSPPQPASARKLAATSHGGKLILRRHLIGGTLLPTRRAANLS